MANLKKIAELAGVSTATVSRALNNDASVKPQTKELIFKIAKENNYDLPISPGSLMNGQTKLIGIIIPDISNIFFAEIVKGAEKLLKSFGYSLIVCISDGEPHEENKYIKELKRQNVDGLILFPSTSDNRALLRMEEHNIPVILIGSEEKGFDVIESDDEKGSYIATQHLIALGHKRVAFISAKLGSSGRIKRYNGYKKAILDNSLPFDEELVIQGSVKRQHGYNATFDLMNMTDPPTAILTQNDNVAIGALSALEELGKKVPEDIALVGYDDTIIASVARPMLTSVAQPKYEIGHLAAERLIQVIADENSRDREKIKIILQPNLVIRQSTIVKREEKNL